MMALAIWPKVYVKAVGERQRDGIPAVGRRFLGCSCPLRRRTQKA